MRTRRRAFLELTKPGITVFIGLTAGAGFVTASGGIGDPAALGLTLLATMLMSGGAAALNHLAERRWDGRMRRTARRPLVSGIITPAEGAAFGWGLSLLGLALAASFLPAATSVWLLLCHGSYVFLYTPLKRRTPLCTLAGAVPGALPVLAGWSATGRPIDVAALALTGLLFMWQIPHFLAIGWMSREDYRSAGCPMLGVVDATGGASARVSLVYALAMSACAGVLLVVSGAGGIYGIVAVLTGGAYIRYAWCFVRRRGAAPARRLFLSSLLVLPLQLIALVADLVV